MTAELQRPKKIILAAGGTGGHIWPALSFGAWINKNHPECAVRYVCGSRQLEREIYAAAHTEPVVLPADGSPLAGRGLGQKAARLRALFASYGKASALVKDFAPDAALVFGGYLSLPVIMACRRAGVRCALQEQNARAGKVTRLASKLGMEIYSGWSECAPLPKKKFIRTGVPVRDFALPARGEAWKNLELEGEVPDGPIVVAMTGSLGSCSVRDELCQAAGEEPFKGWNFVFAAVADQLERPSQNVWLLPKVWDAAKLYGLADMLVLRAGGSTLTEAAVLGLPALVVPWMQAADNHQFYNALAFAGENEGMIWTENDGHEALVSSLLRLNGIKGKNRKKAGDLSGRGGAICENLWSLLFPAV